VIPEGTSDTTARARGSFDRIREKFRATIDDRIALLEVARRELGPTQRGLQALRAIAEEAHRICGVAETLGFVQIGATAARVESEARVLLRPDARTQQQDIRARVDPLIEQLLDGLEAALEG